MHSSIYKELHRRNWDRTVGRMLWIIVWTLIAGSFLLSMLWRMLLPINYVHAMHQESNQKELLDYVKNN